MKSIQLGASVTINRAFATHLRFVSGGPSINDVVVIVCALWGLEAGWRSTCSHDLVVRYTSIYIDEAIKGSLMRIDPIPSLQF